MRFLLAVPFFALACTRATADKVEKTPPAPDNLLNDRAALLTPIQIESLTLTPIVATAAGMPSTDLDVMTLDEGFGQKLVSIKENVDETVNQLTLTNKADRPLFLLAGEVIIGGKQDRIIGKNTIIAANTTLAVPVFCVEHGRWTEGETGREFTTGKALAHGRLRGRASFEGQSEVWAEVAAKNQLRGTQSSTDTYRNVAKQQTGGTLDEQEKKARIELAKVWPVDRAKMIGYVVSLNGKVATVDLFTSPKLFRKLEDKLLRSYLTESIDVPAVANIQPPGVSAVKAFMADADKATEEKAYENDVADTKSWRGTKAAKSRVEYKPSKSGPMGKRAEKPEAPAAVYETYQAK